ncbi:carboxypeptidase-like regulatory domain-containing protein [Niabella ginsengisoli]|uniref:TonB-dependent receptor plug domain-containing protein n=1 Tax=Niabella ginsengisoli TaxID=522298 RepID=A0ABS9SIU3_9BACT|nr:carboxypeptidase-like regulatory domain-containing protein [Niabella ginsengisoli]MCH5598298.1 TonB-dependent receptor plug domain-containing protein [Niabella ginsengisoli]
MDFSISYLTFLCYTGKAISANSLHPQQTLVIKGTVIDSVSNQPVPGVTIQEMGTNNATATNEQGQYELSLQSSDATIEFHSIGYRSVQVKVNGQTIINVSLTTENAAMDEVVVVGFGTQKKQYLTGSITQIDSKKLENRPVNNVGQALQGLAPNLNVSIANGSPNTAPSFNIRGGTSFSKNSSGAMQVQNGSPYILVDGVEMDINMLNPDDIQSVSVLSDAASSAIYGARGAYGVILVTTKKELKKAGLV